MLKDCQIKMPRQMEVLSTKIAASGKTFEMCDETEHESVPLFELQKMEEYSLATVIVKVLSRHQVTKLDGGQMPIYL